MNDWTQIIVSILSGLAVCIPLAVKLVQYVTEAVKNRNWDKLLKLVMADMGTAETKYATGAERKEWVMSLLTSNAQSVGYDLSTDDVTKISGMIDSMCALAKTVNAG